MSEYSKERFDVIQEKIKEIISTNLKDNSELETNDDLNMDNYAINSIDALELLILIEKEFSIEISDDDLSAELFVDLPYLTNYVLKSTSDDYFEVDK